ncbi:MAG: hypothetical protein ACREMA_03480 [Longimicrobiales bacterium]
MHKPFILTLILLAGASAPLSAQFVTPLPKPHDNELAASGSLRRHIAGIVAKIAASCAQGVKSATDDVVLGPRECRTQQMYVDSLGKVALAYCESRFAGKYLDPVYVADCKGAAPLYSRILNEGTATPRARYSPVLEGRLGVVQLYGEAGDLRLLSKFAANVREDQIFVLTDVISGVVGIFPFAISSASIVTKDDSASVPGLTSELTRLMNNGGSIAARLGAPLFASIGTNVRTAFSLYTQGGLLGDLSQTDSLNASGAFVLEGIGGFAIRKPDGHAEYLGDVLIGARLARAWRDAPFGPAPIDMKSFGYMQLVVGLTQGEGRLGVSVLITRAFNKDLDGRIHRMVVNLSAIR